MSLGYLNYNPQTGVQYPVYPYDSGMAYPPVGLQWPIPQVRGNALLPFAISEGMCASNGQWPWFLRTPRVVTGRTAGARSVLGATVQSGALTVGMTLAFYALFAYSMRMQVNWKHAWMTALATGVGVGVMAWAGMRNGPQTQKPK